MKNFIKIAFILLVVTALLLVYLVPHLGANVENSVRGISKAMYPIFALAVICSPVVLVFNVVGVIQKKLTASKFTLLIIIVSALGTCSLLQYYLKPCGVFAICENQNPIKVPTVQPF